MEANALIARANNASTNNFSNSSCKFWKFDWHTPVKPRSSGTATAEKPDGNDNNDEDLYNFKYKTWLASEHAAWDTLSATPNETIDLSLFDRTKQQRQPTQQTNNNIGAPATNTQNPAEPGLSADDIRGAVGGQESLPGFNTSQPSQEKSQDQDKVREQNAEVVESTETTEPGPQTKPDAIDGDLPKTTETSDADGDIKLD
ncbi:LAFA_0E00958g1_1 [Lachancea sp. 'fantastica']|nr:LAFA_0E00958g1_1 [Lachancea sp. 'fantastica']